MTKLYVCTSCNKKKQEFEFYKRSARPKGTSSKCKLCIKITDKERYDRNREYILNQKKEYRENNLDIIKEKTILDRELNNDFYRKRDKDYYRNNIEHNRARKNVSTSKRRALLNNSIPPWMTEEEEGKIRSLYKMCKSISKKTGIEHHVDHIIPINSELVRGFHTIHNLRIIPKTDNLRKSNKIIEEIV